MVRDFYSFDENVILKWPEVGGSTVLFFPDKERTALIKVVRDFYSFEENVIPK